MVLWFYIFVHLEIILLGNVGSDPSILFLDDYPVVQIHLVNMLKKPHLSC